MNNEKVFTDKKEADKYWGELRNRGFHGSEIYTASHHNVITKQFEYTVFTGSE